MAKNLVHSNLYIFIKRTCFLTLHYLPLECLDRVQNMNYTQRRVLLTSGFEKVVKEQWRVPISRSGDGTLSCYIDDPSKPILRRRDYTDLLKGSRRLLSWRRYVPFFFDFWTGALVLGFKPQIETMVGKYQARNRIWTDVSKSFSFFVDIDRYCRYWPLPKDSFQKHRKAFWANLHRFCCDRL